MLALLSALVAFGCVAASARRLWFVANATFVSLEVLDKALARANGADVVSRLRALVVREPKAAWEGELLDALGAPENLRPALVNEQLTELDYRLDRWSRVPRVCASLATSFSFMLATLVLRRGVAEAGDLSTDAAELAVLSLVGDALTVAAMGVVGTAFCIGAHAEARRMAKATAKAADRVVERLENLASS